jgi:hypothetical protein
MLNITRLLRLISPGIKHKIVTRHVELYCLREAREHGSRGTFPWEAVRSLFLQRGADTQWMCIEVFGHGYEWGGKLTSRAPIVTIGLIYGRD